MNQDNMQITEVRDNFISRLNTLENKSDILKAPELKNLYTQLSKLPDGERAAFGKMINDLRQELQELAAQAQGGAAAPAAIDLSAPFDVNQRYKPRFLNSEYGGGHPLMRDLDKVSDIFYRMGFTAIESRQLDDDYHMFTSLNFPVGHPARDDFDTFMTTEGLIAPAHTSTMQNRVLKQYRDELTKGDPIAVVIPGRCFRKDDLDARHENTFYQIEGVYVGEGVNAGNLIATLKTFLEEYFDQELDIKIQPCYFPFTEPSFEFALSCPFCQKNGCPICSFKGWIELIGCGLIHPNVLAEAGIDNKLYSGFAWGFGIDRLVFMKQGIDDIRYFESGRLEFLRQFK